MFRKNLIILSGLVLFATVTNAQDRYFTKTGQIDFFSKAALEDIAAKNNTVTAVLDTKSGAMQFSVPMKGFEFEKKLMQEHFNENYVESDKYPKADFKGVVANNAAVNFAKDGTYNVTVKGKLTIHGVTKDVEAPGTIKVNNGKVDAASTFNIKLSDYNISIPAVVKDKISNSIKISVDTRLEPFKG
ncbi:YceI family protein [Flavisolibacter ginsenosidimutans]|uniref:YceI family protein n=1 Tax=Flavisolibacter ginsenosidimutans TaxID=661481 RepID=A0A5B8UFD5_9BACT|nr:YceI family protein [Flavisolibacter ginsenosidimutans]QEC55183.1 YceI family protein [Flavisolibacter ginsenosidimutans]